MRIALLGIWLAWTAPAQVGTIWVEGTNVWVRFSNCPPCFVLQTSTNWAGTNWVDVDLHKRLQRTNAMWSWFEFRDSGDSAMKFWRVRSCGAGE